MLSVIFRLILSFDLHRPLFGWALPPELLLRIVEYIPTLCLFNVLEIFHKLHFFLSELFAVSLLLLEQVVVALEDDLFLGLAVDFSP